MKPGRVLAAIPSVSVGAVRRFGRLFVAIDRRSGLFEQADQLRQFAFREVAKKSTMGQPQRFVDLREQLDRLRSDLDVDDPPVFLTPPPDDETGCFQAIDKTRDRRNDLDHTRRDLQRRERTPFAAKDAQDVVLRGRKPVLAKEAAHRVVQSVARAKQIQSRLLLERIERSALLDLGLQPYVRRRIELLTPFSHFSSRWPFARQMRDKTTPHILSFYASMVDMTSDFSSRCRFAPPSNPAAAVR